MKVTVFAATGGVGRQLVVQALEAGHQVTAVARNPRGLDPRATTVVADLSTADGAQLAAAVAGADAVFSALGPRSAGDAGIVARGTKAIAAAMTAAGARRLVVVSASPVATVASPGRPNPPRHDPGDGFLPRYVLGPIIKAVLRTQYADLALMEDVLRDSGLDWTAIRPPRLVDAPLTGKYRTAWGQNVRGGLKIGRADVAHLMLQVLQHPEASRQTVGVGY